MDEITDIRALVDLERYPLEDLASANGQALVGDLRAQLAQDGAAALPQFLHPWALDALASEARELAPLAFAGPDAVSPYFFNYDIAGANVPAAHPTRRQGQRNLAQVAYDLIPAASLLCRLYHSDLVTQLVAAVRRRKQLYRLADHYQSLNISVMGEGGCQQWHFDRGELVTTLMVQEPKAGGIFEYVPRLRSDDDEHFDEVQSVLDGDRTRVRQIGIGAGTLNLFQGHYSLHRVTPVAGTRQRLQTIFAFADAPDTHGNLKSSILHYGPRVSAAEFARRSDT